MRKGSHIQTMHCSCTCGGATTAHHNTMHGPSHAGWITRWAHLIGFADARANFARLQEIPVRLREHADQKKSEAEAAFAVLRGLDEDARKEDCIVDLETARDTEQANLEAIDARIDEAAGRYEQLMQTKEDFAAGEDEDYRKVVEYVSSELQRDDMQELRRDAMATPFPDDDLIVSRLFEGEQQVQQLGDSLKELKRCASSTTQKFSGTRVLAYRLQASSLRSSRLQLLRRCADLSYVE